MSKRRRSTKATADAQATAATLRWQLSEGPACDISWLVHTCEREGKTFIGRIVPAPLWPLSARLANAITKQELRRSEILKAASTLCRHRWRTLCLRSAHRSISTYPHLLDAGDSAPLTRDYSAVLGEPYVSHAKVAAFGLICVDRAAAHSNRGNTARAAYYTSNATAVVDIFTKPNPRLVEHGKKFSGRSRGVLLPETRYLVKLVKRYSHEDAEGLWYKLRDFAQRPDHSGNPTPGRCPFTTRYEGAKLSLWKREKPYRRRAFENAVSKIRSRIKAGEFRDE